MFFLLVLWTMFLTSPSTAIYSAHVEVAVPIALVSLDLMLTNSEIKLTEAINHSGARNGRSRRGYK